MMKKSALIFLGLLSSSPAFADGFGAYGFAQSTLHAIAPPPPVGTAPVNTTVPQIVGLDYPNNGTTAALTGNTTTFAADNGVWSNSPLSYSYNWHTVAAPGTSLGTGATFTIASVSGSALLGQPIELDVTAANLAGSTTQTSHWFGPISTTTPVAPLPFELQSSLPLQLSTAPVNFLENGHAVFPGCLVPPVVPPNTATTGSAAHVWYFDPVSGTSQDAQITAGVPATSQGRLGHAFNSINDIFNNTTVTAGAFVVGQTYTINFSGTTSFTSIGAANNALNTVFVATGVGSGTGTAFRSMLFGVGATNVIAPGDTIYFEPGNSGHPLGALAFGGIYSTSTGLIGGTPIWTWILADPAATSVPVVASIAGVGGGSNLIFKNFNVEQYRNGDLTALAGSIANVFQNMMFENINESQWLGHSADAWLPSSYPTTGGTSDGTILTAAPTEIWSGPQDAVITNLSASVSVNDTVLNTATIAPMGYYMWSNGYYYTVTSGVFPPVTGIPNGSKVVAVNGLDAAHFFNVNASLANPAATPATVTARDAAALTSLSLGGTVTTTGGLPASNDGNYWIVKAGTTTFNPTVYVWGTSSWVARGTILPVPWTTDQAIFLTNGVVSSLSLIVGQQYTITAAGISTNWTSVGGSPGTVGTVFTATGTSTGGSGGGASLAHATDNHIQHYTVAGGSWTDLGTPTVTIAACDPVNDAATGCPTTNYPGIASNVPGCDPITSFGGTGTRSGGCPGGTPVVWNGASAAIASGTALNYTPVMTIVPANYWNSVDWSGNAAAAFHFTGQINSAVSLNPSQPNVTQGMECISVKDSSFRYGAYAFSFSAADDVLVYNTKIKWLGADAFDVYSDNRIWIISDYYAEPTLIEAHQDGIQYGTTNGLEATNWMQNYAVDNEFYQYTDPTDYFPRTMQGITVTDNIAYGAYIANNIVFAQTGSNNIGINGPWNTIINNVGIGTLVGIGNQAKSGLTTPLHDLFANNVGNGIGRDSGSTIPNGCNVTTGDQSTVETNYAIPFLSPTAQPSSTFCLPSSTTSYTSDAAAGIYTGQTAWTATDWRNPSGTYPLFTAFHPVGPTAGQPGFGVTNPSPFISLCIQGWFQWTGSCAPGSNGIANMRPVSSYTGTSAATVANILATGGVPVDLSHFPSTGSPGDQAILGLDTACANSTGTVCLSSPNAYANLVIAQGVYTRGSTNFGTMSDWGSVAGFTLNSTAANFGPSCTGSAAVAITGNPTITCPSANILSWSPTQITGIITGPHEPANLSPFFNVTVTTNVGASIPSTSMTSTSNNLISSGNLPFGPGLKSQGTALTTGCGAGGTASCATLADHDGKAWGSPPSIGAYQ